MAEYFFGWSENWREKGFHGAEVRPPNARDERSATNGVYPFISDASHLLGANLALTSETLWKTGTVYIPDMIIATDIDRDGNTDIPATGAARTATNRYFTYWINDDAGTWSRSSCASGGGTLFKG